MISENKKYSIFLIHLLFSYAISLFAQNAELRGVSFRDLHLSKADSACLRINSTWYSGRNQYGIAQNSETFYIKWVNDKEKYYPLMKEAWRYCMEQVPFQNRLYKDGILLNRWMLQNASDSVTRMKYFDEMMILYDKWIQNIDSINKYTVRIEDRSSIGGVMMQKAREYARSIIGEENVYSDAKAQELFTKAAEVIREDFKNNKELGGDIDQGGLEYYLGFSLNDYAKANNQFVDVKIPAKRRLTITKNKNTVSLTDTAEIRRLVPDYSSEKLREMARHNQYVDSLEQARDKVKRDAKEPLIDKYDFIMELCERQINSLNSDYVDSLSTDGNDSLNVVMNKVVAPYELLKERCKTLLESANIKVNIQHLQDVENMYAGDLMNHKESLDWLHLVVDICENTIDISPDNISYPFYEEVLNYYIKARDKKIDNIGSINLDNQHLNRTNWGVKARDLWNSMPKNWITKETTLKGALVIYYYKKAIETDPRNRATYQSNINSIKELVRGNLFMYGIKDGQIVTVNGVTFKLNLK